jgi:lysophospholipase L1-like esterase
MIKSKIKMKKINCILLMVITSLSFSCSKNEVAPGAAKPNLSTTFNSDVAAGAIGDPNIRYFGRWDFTSSTTQYVSYWGGAYFRVKFTGTTVKVKVGTNSNYYAKIDNGAWTSYIGVTGTINLTPTPLASGTHTVSVAQGKDYNYVFNFQGLVLDAGATTSAPPVSSNLIEYIGDSVTSGYTDPQADVSDYAWVCAEDLGAEHTQIAYPGIALVNGYGVNATKIGMDVQYFKEQSLAYPSSPNWDFTKYTPNIIVVNLGQNDSSVGVPDATFQSDYVSLLANVRAKFPNAQIFAMSPLWGVESTTTSAAVSARVTAGDTKLHFVNTSGWLTQGTSDYGSGVHPSVAGHIKVANLLKPILAPYLNSGTPAIANGTYKIINRNGGLALDVKGKLTANSTAVDQWSYTGATNQQWTVTSLGGGQYKIIGVQSGRALDVNGKLTADGTPVDIYDYTGASNQLWTITATSGGYYNIVGVQSGKPLEVEGNVTTPGALVDIYTNHSGNNQQWAFQAP